MPRSKEYSEQKAGAIDAEVEKILERAHEKVRRMITERRSILDEVAHRLLEKEVLDGDELRALLATHVEPKRAAS
jgi:cell division protease FtsH